MIGKGHFYLPPNPIATAPPPRARLWGYDKDKVL